MPTGEDTIYLLDLPVRLPGGGTDTLHFCTGSGYTTSPADTPPNTFYEPKLLQPGLTIQSMFSPGCTSGSSSGGWGEIILSNKTGDLDYLLDCGLDGVAPVIWRGVAGQPLSTFAPSLPGTTEQPEVSLEQITIRIKDRTIELKVPVQTETYAGDNLLPDGLEGTAELKDKHKPLLLGKCNNCTPVLVNSSKLIYQISSGLCSIPATYDNGVPLTTAAGYSTVEDLLATAPEPSSYAVFSSVSGTYFRVGSSPAGLITADGIETAINTAGQIIKRLVSNKLGADQVVAQSIIDMDQVAPYVVGYFAGTSAIDISEVLDSLCASVGGWWGVDLDGHFWAKQLTAPDPAQALFILTDLEIDSFERLATFDSDKGLPVYRVNVDFSRNWTVQTSGLAGSIQAYQQTYETDDSEQLTAERRALLAMEYIRTKQEDPSVLSFHPLAAEITLQTSLDALNDANTEALRVLNLRKVRRDRIKVGCKLGAIQYPDGGYWDDEAITETAGARLGHSLDLHGGWLYLTGGLPTNIRLDLNNPTGAWDDAGVADLPEQRLDHASVVYNDWLYVIGGRAPVVKTASVIRLDLNNPAGAWDDVGVTDLPAARHLHAAFVHDGYVYVVGGEYAGGETASVIRLNLNNPTGAWDDVGVTDLPAARKYFAAVKHNNWLYVMGGRIGGLSSTSVIRLDLNNPSGAWDDIGVTDLPVKRYDHTAVVFDGHLYVIGGRVAEIISQSVIRLALNNPTGEWDDFGVTDLPEARRAARAIDAGGVMYVIGGTNGVSVPIGNTTRYRLNNNPNDTSHLSSLGRTAVIAYPRYGYENGRAMKILGTEKDQQANTITLELWG